MGLCLLNSQNFEAIFHSYYFPHSHTEIVRKQVRPFIGDNFDINLFKNKANKIICYLSMPGIINEKHNANAKHKHNVVVTWVTSTMKKHSEHILLTSPVT